MNIIKFVAPVLLVAFCTCNGLSQKMEVIKKSITTMDHKPYLIHTVYFWTKEGTSADQIASFEKGLIKLGTCPQIQNYYWGPPAATEARGVVDHSYAYAINVHFANLESELAYQKEPIHLAFIENHKDIWEKVIVYDNIIK